MGSCLCLRKGELICEDEADVTTTTFEPTPYKWAVINPRPSLTRLLLRQQQHQTKQLALPGVLSAEISHQSNAYPLCPTLISEPRYSLTCLEVLEGCTRLPDSPYASFFDQQKQELVNSEINPAGSSPQMVGLPGCCLSSPHERSCLEDHPSSSTFSHVFKSESTFSHITAEFGESDESSIYESPEKPLLQEKLVHRAMKSEPKIRIFSPKYGRMRCSKRLPKKFWASEQETLLQKSPILEKRQSFQ